MVCRSISCVAAVALLLGLIVGCDRRASKGVEARLEAGPWGELTACPMLLAPSLEVLSRVDLADGPPIWRLHGLSDHAAAELLAGLGLPDVAYDRLIGSLRHAPPGTDDFLVAPDLETVAKLSPEARASLYGRLGLDPFNRAQMNAFRFCGSSPAAWLEGWDLSPQTRGLVEPLIYRNGNVLFFADAALVFPRVAGEERTRLIQALAAEVSLKLTLHVPEGADVDALTAYWGWHEERTDVRTLLRSLSRQPGGGSIDVIHLLPPFARSRLYRYPDQDTLLSNGDSRDCHWTALNFFNDVPDDRYVAADAVLQALGTEYEEVAEPRFGDLVVYRSGGEVYHSAVYIAADILFTRNGTRFSRPWMFIRMSQMRDFYPQLDKIETMFMRRRPGARPEDPKPHNP